MPAHKHEITEETQADFISMITPLMSAVEGETMRTQIVLFAAQIDERLEHLLSSYLKDSRKKSKEDELFKGAYAPLASFSGRISICYRLGLISRDEADAFDVLRALRNDCAHKIFSFSVNDSSVASRLQKFIELTCQDESKAMWLGGLLCPKTDEQCLMYCCFLHIFYLQLTGKRIRKVEDKFTMDVFGYGEMRQKQPSE